MKSTTRVICAVLICFAAVQGVQATATAEGARPDGLTVSMTDIEQGGNGLHPICYGQGVDQMVTIVNSIQPWLPEANLTAHACVKVGLNIDFALVNGPLWSGQRLAFRRHSEQNFYFVNVAQGTAWSPRFVETTDNYVVVEYTWAMIGGPPQTKLYVYDLSNALVPDMVVQGKVLDYKLDINKRIYYMWDENDPSAQHQPGSYMVSENGKYLAVYVDGKGFVRIDLEAQKVTKVLAQARDAFGGQAPSSVEISPNGRFIYGGGGLVGVANIIDAEGCGDEFGAGFSDAPLVHPCWILDAGPIIRAAIGSQFTSGKATLSSTGDLAVDVYPYPATPSIKPKRIVIGNVENLLPKLTYLALGDSYSSGEGDTGKNANGASFYLPLTDDTPNTCHVSSRSYPFLLKDNWGILGDDMKSVACSGARVTMDYYHPLANYNGQDQRLVGTGDITKSQAISLERFIPGYVPQLEFVKKYKPKVVTLTGGGNDVGFADILAYCATPVSAFLPASETCGYASSSYMHSLLWDTIHTQYAYTVHLLEEIKKVSPSTSVYVIGYPTFVNPRPLICSLNTALLDGDELEMIDAAVKEMNKTLKLAADSVGVKYVDIESSLEGGRLCEGAEYVTGVWDEGILSNTHNQAFHPNAIGHQRIAQAILREVGYSPTAQDSAPSISIQPLAIGVPTYRSLIVKNPTMSKGGQMDISLHGGFKPGSTVSLVEFSREVSLGSYVADEDGSLAATIKQPSVIETGNHILIASGTDPYGNPIRYLQYIVVIGDSTQETSTDSPIKLSAPSNIETPLASSLISSANSHDDATRSLLGPPDASKKGLLPAPTPSAAHTDRTSGDDTPIAVYLAIIVFIGLIVVWIKNRIAKA